jgi:hypothetical protein
LRARDLRLRLIPSADASRIIRALHYSGKAGRQSQVNFGVFIDGRCGGAIQFGDPLDRRKVLPLVEGTGWNQMLELNRLALAEWMPRNTESRALAVALKLLTYADATQSGDGAIYRALGFTLTLIKPNNQLLRFPNGEVKHVVALQCNLARAQSVLGGRSLAELSGGGSSTQALRELGAVPLPGYQLRYIKFLDPSWASRLAVPAIPYGEIEARGAGMYRGQPRAGSIGSDAPVSHTGKGGASPTPALHLASHG